LISSGYRIRNEQIICGSEEDKTTWQADRDRSRLFAGIAALALGLTAMASTPHTAAADYQFKVLHHFCPLGANGCTHGYSSRGSLTIDVAGNLYGTTVEGGIRDNCDPRGCGTAFELSPDSSSASGWGITILHRFCPGGGSCINGSAPNGGLVMDGADNLYGTTMNGGINRAGVVFELTPNATKTAWTETVLHHFCPRGGGCDDGWEPSGLIMDGAGNLYGTAGGSNGGGLVFELMPNADHTAWTETVLYRFCHVRKCADGRVPLGALFMDQAGNLYGTTRLGGNVSRENRFGAGVVFELAPNADRTAWTETVLHSFCGGKCGDGSDPYASGVTMDTAGNLYGITLAGGSSNVCSGTGSPGCGIVFELTPNTNRTAWTETVLYRFCAQGGSCEDGAGPGFGVVVDGAGNLYGTAEGGNPWGAYYAGVVFELTPNASGTAWTETTLHSFCAQGTCADGAGPDGLIMDISGNLYGVTAAGGIDDAGVAFELAKSQ
jgi:hypothetical protein